MSSACCTMPSKRQCKPLLLLLLLSLAARVGHAQEKLAPKDRLQEMVSQTTLTSLTRPWHLKLEVTLPAYKGQPELNGVIERWQAGPDFKMISTFGSSLITTWRLDANTYIDAHGNPPPDAVDTVLRSVLHPGPEPEDVDGTEFDLRSHEFGKVKLDCIMLAQHIPRVAYAPLGLFPTYCLSTQNQLALSYEFGDQTTLRNPIGKFLNRDVTVGVSILQAGRVEAKGKVAVPFNV